MMNRSTRLNFLLLLSIGLTLGSCKEGPVQMAGIDGSGTTPPKDAVAFGTITGFGSVTVNGVIYDTTDAVFTVNRETGTQDDLAIGDVVLIQGTINEDGAAGNANSVDFDDNVKGPINSIDPSENSLIVLGQQVHAFVETVFDSSIVPANLSGLSIGDNVEVSGFINSFGEISATRIEKQANGSLLEVTGIVVGLDTDTSRFRINSLVIDYSLATLEDFPAGGIANQQVVEVIGDTVSGAGELVASRVIFRQTRIGIREGAHVEIEGFITSFVSQTDFEVNGVPTTTNSQTMYPTGGSGVDLRLNEKVEVEGEVNENGIIVASVIRFRSFAEFGNFHFEPDGGLNGAGLLTDHASDQPGPPGSSFDYSGRIALPGCSGTPESEWFIDAGREVIGNTQVLRASGSDLVIDIVNAGAFDGCFGATGVDNGLLELSLRTVDDACEAFFTWDFGYTSTAAGVEYFSVESQDWQRSPPPFDNCTPGHSLRLTGDYDFSKIVQSNGTVSTEFLSTEAMDFYVVFHLCPGGTGCR
jgi:hypothetical protein